MPPPTFVTRLQVRSYELDSFGHVNHANYLGYMEFARFQAFAEAGFEVGGLVARGWGIHVVRVEVDYRAEAFLGDELVVETVAVDWGRTSMTLAQRIARGDERSRTVVDARVVIVWVGAGGRPMRIPAEAKLALGGGESGDDADGEPGGQGGSA